MHTAEDLLESLKTVAWMDASEQKKYFDDGSGVVIKSSLEGLYLIVLGLDADTIIKTALKYRADRHEAVEQSQRQEVKMLAEKIGKDNLRRFVDELMKDGDRDA